MTHAALLGGAVLAVMLAFSQAPTRSAVPDEREYGAAARPTHVRDLKDEVDGNIYVSGSGRLVRAMLADGLVDGLHFFVFPLAIGGGSGPFPDGAKTALKLTGTEAYDSGVVHLAYQTAD